VNPRRHLAAPGLEKDDMRTMQLLTLAGLFLASGSAHAGPGLPIGHDDTAYSDDARAHEYEARARSLPRRVDVTITDDGPQPSKIRADRSERLELVVTRQTERMCRSNLLIPDYGISKELPLGKPVAIAIVAQDRGHVGLLCPVEDSPGAFDVP
jgi:hypothetical protein